jgi:cytoskeleton protein RodZ
MNTSDNHEIDREQAEDLVDTPSVLGRRSPGAMLSAQRETLELSIQQVADQLNLTMHFVRALESDSFEKLPGEVFVRGYIRAYSNLLRLDPVQILLIFDEFTSQKIARKEEAIKRRDRRRQDKNRPWIVFSGFAFVAVAVGLWYANPATPTTNAVSEPLVAIAPVISVLSTVPLEIPVSVAPLDAAVSATPLETTEPAIDLPQTLSMSEVEAPVGALANDSTPVVGTLAGKLEAHDWAGSDELTLRFEADCWVEIEHLGGEQVYRDQSRAGDTLVIKGTAPFSVLLGNARDVAITFNGRSMDISNNVRSDNTARLSIGM